MWQTVLLPSARAFATTAVTLLSVWVTPRATTPLSAQSTSRVRLCRRTSALPVIAATRAMSSSKAPRLPSGFARASQ